LKAKKGRRKREGEKKEKEKGDDDEEKKREKYVMHRGDKTEKEGIFTTLGRKKDQGGKGRDGG
jgi:26S proteasome regulatory complex component